MTRHFFIYIFISVVSVCIILTSVYYWLGGFDEVNVYELEGQEKTIIGKYYKGYRNSPEITEYFNQCQRLVMDSSVIGTVTRVVYKNDSLAYNEVEYFIGIDLAEEQMAMAPVGFQIREFSSSKRFAVFLSMNPWVRPSSKKIDQMFESKAASMDYNLSDILLEIYYIDDSMSIEAWVN